MLKNGDKLQSLKELVFKKLGFFMKFTQARQQARFKIYDN